MINQPPVHYLKDYKPPIFLLETVALTFELAEDFTTVTSVLTVKKNPKDTSGENNLILSGEQMELLEVKLDGKILSPSEYKVDAATLTVFNVPSKFQLEIVNRIKPQENTALSGLYRSNDVFCTQCEPHGFRRITYSIDRPDVLATYTTTIIADQARYPILLSNGNCIAQKTLPNNRHSVTWHDPFKKPSYLFALVAGDFDCLEDQFVTVSKRSVALKIFVDKGQKEKAQHAMDSLKKIMRWDEKAYGREYDLDIFMIVAINDFNMGAMENKGLNIFNAKYILTKPETATDNDYEGVLVVVGHEYLHNWTGDRVTCRDWFQLSLKEGLTVFREQEFTGEMTSEIVERINTVRTLRNTQFLEDSGPLAHPVQPDSYIEINNFYTATVYNKGAELIHMMKVLLGKEKFRQGMDLYFERHDGSAVTIEDFIKAMEDASKQDLSQFRLWYSQAGTPEITIAGQYDANNKKYTLKVEQFCPPTPRQPEKKPMQIPLALGLVNASGKDMPLQLQGENKPSSLSTRVLELKKPIEEFHFINVSEKPIPSFFRDFSAPVKLKFNYSDEELLSLFAHDADGFNRWNAGQEIASRELLKQVANFQQQKPMSLNPKLLAAFKELLTTPADDKAFLTELLILPNERYLGELMKVIEVDGIHEARQFISRELAKNLHADFLQCYTNNKLTGPYTISLEAIAQRKLKNLSLSYLMLLNEPEVRLMAYEQFHNADNMTDQLAALIAFNHIKCEEREDILTAFYNQWQHEPLVVDKWFAIQACSSLPGTMERVKQLLQHPAFQIKNPNKVRALIGAFCHENHVHFHAKNGEGYEFLAEQILIIDKLNPQIAARLLTPMTFWKRYDTNRQLLMQTQLDRILSAKDLSRDVYEIAAKSRNG